MKVFQPVFDTYWKFAAERQEIFFKKQQGQVPPYTNDPILRTYKFCNAYRASDRVSQYLIRNVIYAKESFSEADILFRIFLFRLLNRPQTWEALEAELGSITLNTFSVETYDQVLTSLKQAGPIYGNAFILCANNAFGYSVKHRNHLALLKSVDWSALIAAQSLQKLFEILRDYPLIGNFMAYQLAIDFNYSPVFDFSENDFTVAGPGAVRGIRKCFVDTKGKTDADIIMHMVENQDAEFRRLGIAFKDLWGRSLQAIDCQNVFCEVDKYSRVQFPNLASNRVRIKTKYQPNGQPIAYFYPPKWNIHSN